MSQTNEPDIKNTRYRGRALLFVSLALNLLIVGMVAGAMYQRASHAPAPDQRLVLRDLGYGPYGRALSPGDRRKIGQKMISRATDLDQNRQEYRAQMVTLLNALRAVPFEPDVVRDVLGEQSAKLLERANIGRDLLLEHFETMTQAERSSYAKHLEKMLRRPPPPRKN